MDEFKENFEDEFFVIDSNNLDSQETRFIGYSIQNNQIITEENYNSDLDLDKWGSYILIECDENAIDITQDSNGNYGLYIFKNSDYFAISNSFLKLVEYLKETYELTLNKDNAEAFLLSYPLYSFDYDGTLVNEITTIQKDVKISINKTDKSIELHKIDYKFQSVNLDSPEGIEILDNWYYKWIDIIRNIKSKSNNITIDLSGGFDTRVAAILWLNANIDFDKIHFRTKTIESFGDNYNLSDKSKSVFAQDYQIASEIAKYFNFTLNNNYISPEIMEFEDITTSIKLSFYAKLGFHKEMYYEFFKSKEQLYSLTGDGGEYIRGYISNPPQQFVKSIVNNLNNIYPPFADSVSRIVNNTIDKISELYGVDRDSDKIMEFYYNDVMGKYHFGKSCVEAFFSNRIKITPLLDYELHKLKTDENESDTKTLIALLYLRYCPELLNFEFEGGRKINEETLDYAKKINEKYPLKVKELEYISGPELIENDRQLPPNFDINNEPKDYLLNLFLSKNFEMEFKKHYSSKVYDIILENTKKRDFQYMAKVYAAIAVIKIIQDIEYSQTNNMDNGWLNNAIYENQDDIKPEIYYELLKYNTSHIDIKSIGQNNNFEIIEKSDNELNIDYTKKDLLVIQSLKNSLDLKIKCLNKGKVNFKLRSINCKDKNNEDFPIFIDYTKFIINDLSIIDEPKLSSYDNYFEFEMDVEDSQILDIHIEWNPFTKSSSYTNELKLLKNENEKYKDILNSNSWKLTKPLRNAKSLFKK